MFLLVVAESQGAIARAVPFREPEILRPFLVSGNLVARLEACAVFGDLDARLQACAPQSQESMINRKPVAC